MKRRPKLTRLSIGYDDVRPANDVDDFDIDDGVVDLRALLDDELERQGKTIYDLAREVAEERVTKLRVVEGERPT